MEKQYTGRLKKIRCLEFLTKAELDWTLAVLTELLNPTPWKSYSS